MRADAVRNRAAVLTAARDLMASAGPGVGMDEIARRAGVAVGTLYGHFPSKTALVSAVVERSLDDLGAGIGAALAAIRAGIDAGEEFRRCFRLAASRHRTDMALKGAAIGLGVDVPDVSSPAARPLLSALEQLIHAASATGAVAPDVTALDVAALLDGVPADRARAERYVDIALRGLRPDPAPPMTTTATTPDDETSAARQVPPPR